MAMDHCPWWLGPLLLNPLRNLLENPHRLLAGRVSPGMRVLEPGCGMGYFTLPLARLVGPGGLVVAVDLQPRMLAGLHWRLKRAGLAERVRTRRCPADSLGVADLAGSMDLAVAMHLVHETPDPAGFMAQVAASLRPGGVLLFAEPKHHVSPTVVAQTLEMARDNGLRILEPLENRMARGAWLVKEGAPAGEGGGQ